MTNKGSRAAVDTLARIKETARQREATRVVQLPAWPDSKRGTPNSFIRSALFAAIQSKDRTFLKDATLASQKGITVKFTGEQLNQEDLTVWETLVHLSRQHPLGQGCDFAAHGFLKSLGLHTGLSQHRQLHSTIIRLTACAVEITHEGKTYFGPLVKSGFKHELTNHYRIELNKELIRLFGESQWTALDWQQRQQLRGKHLAQALHAFYSSHSQPFPMKLESLQAITGSRNSQPASFKRQVRAALEILVALGFLQSFEIERGQVSVRRSSQVLMAS